MTAAFSPDPTPKRRPSQNSSGSTTSSKVISLAQARLRKQGEPRIPQSDPEPQTVVKIFPAEGVKPWWLKSLMTVQTVCSIATVLFVSTGLGLYGVTVYNDSIWSKEYQTLERLRRQDHQFRAANEVLKNQIAKDAENPRNRSKGDKPMDNMIFMQPASLRPELPSEPAPYLDLGARSGFGDDQPIGY
ncbi:MAG: hypothetical protein WBA77_21780 [Microcoleaceae cyanobacterium]